MSATAPVPLPLPHETTGDARSGRGDDADLMQGALDSAALLGGERRRVIVHQGERYWLQITRAGKLLLTK